MSNGEEGVYSRISNTGPEFEKKRGLRKDMKRVKKINSLTQRDEDNIN